jgi:hypothetical protein
MPISALFVEGRLDAEILGTILSGAPLVESLGSKHTLMRKAEDERRKNNVRYLRDRDFDYEPDPSSAGPIEDSTYSDGTTLGWRWSRHELESYLIEPSLAEAALGWKKAEFEARIVQAAREIRHFQLARWVIGAAKMQLPPTRDLATKPLESSREFDLPANLAEASILSWVNTHIHRYYRSIQEVLANRYVRVAIEKRRSFFGRFPGSCSEALLWCSGKNLMTALAPWFIAQGISHPSEYRLVLRDWIMANPDETLSHLPEWRNLVTLVRS